MVQGLVFFLICFWKGVYPPRDLPLRRFLDANEHGFFGLGSRLRLTLLLQALGLRVEG